MTDAERKEAARVMASARTEAAEKRCEELDRLRIEACQRHLAEVSRCAAAEKRCAEAAEMLREWWGAPNCAVYTPPTILAILAILEGCDHA